MCQQMLVAYGHTNVNHIWSENFCTLLSAIQMVKAFGSKIKGIELLKLSIRL